MHNRMLDKLMSRVLGVGASFTLIFVISNSVTDPVNAPKLLVLGVMAFASFSILAVSNLDLVIRENKFVSALLFMFSIIMLFSTLSSKSPISQNIYGVYGRNNGMLTYLSLSLIFFTALALKRKDSFDFINLGLIVAGLVNVLYCFWVVAFGDFIGWSNPYGNILGTLGNPNFIGSFLGIFLTAYLAKALDPSTGRTFRISAVLVVPLTAFEIVKSHAIQGRVVAAAGIAILLFLWMRPKFNKVVLAFYGALCLIFGTGALLGALQIGPLSSFIYKTSVSLRGQYWLAGWNTGSSHPLSGVGMDAFGDWYRRSRDLHALELPGVNTVVNASHNVPIDIFAFGGWPLFITYVSLMSTAGICAIKIIKRNKNFDSTFTIIFTAWIGYQLQSIISINQIGLAVWGWLLSGCVIAYEKISQFSIENEINIASKKSKAKSNPGFNPTYILAGSLGGLIGLLVALPPVMADAKWRSAQLARNLPALESTMQSSYFNPPNGMKYLANVQTLEQSQLFDLSRKYALEATNWNPESFELWKVLYLVKNSTLAEKKQALENMKRLDPLNPDVTSIK